MRGRETGDGRREARDVRRGDGLIAGLYLCGYAVIRFGIEILRGDPRAAVGPFSISQAISIGMIVVGLLFICHATRKTAVN